MSSFEEYRNDQWRWFVMILVGLVVFLLGLGTYLSARSNGETDYCYVEMWSPQQMAPQYQLWAHRPWRMDRNLGVYPTIDEATKASLAMGCRLNTAR